MIRSVLSAVVQKKFFLMSCTCVVYIIGLFAFFADKAVLIAFLGLLINLWLILKNYISPKLVLFWYFVFFVALFNADLRVKTFDDLYQIAPQNVSIIGRIASIPTESNSKTKFFVNVSNISYGALNKKFKAKTLVSLNESDSGFRVGDLYRFQGKLRTPFQATNPSQFDYGKYLRNFGVFSILYVENGNYRIQRMPLSLKWKFLRGLNNIRINIIAAHSKYLKSPNLELLGGVVFGDDAISPPDELKNSFKNSGLLHILAASGMNVALIYGIWFFILRKLKVPFNLSVLSGIFIIIFYTLMTGLGPSVIRAAIMLIFILVGKLIDRDAHSISLLAFVALLMLIYNPTYINDVGFQLSFIVTLGLLLMTPIVFEKTKFLPNWLSGAVFVPVIAQLWVAPIQMYYFNSFSSYSVLANILTLPFLTIVSFGGFISAVLALIKPIALKVCYIFDLILNPALTAIVRISDFFCHLPNSLIQMPQPDILQIFCYYGLITLLILRLKFGRNNKIMIISSVLSLFLICSFIKLPDQKFETIAFNVQNADAFLIKTPKEKYFLIDSGKIPYKSGKSQAQMIILEYLKDKGIKDIEGLIITHFDSDHAGGAVDLIKNLNIKNIYVNSINDESRLAQEIYIEGKDKIKPAKNNEIIYREDNLTVKNYISIFSDNDNENSVITLFSNNDFDELFMGDAGANAFEKIKEFLPEKIEVLKVGHHGAKNVINSSLLDRINPSIAIISTGFNTYGHPNDIILELLKRRKIKILRTDRQNSIKIVEKNNHHNVYSFINNSYKKLF